ncbi:MAG: hypothetical protein ACK5RO_08985, partial [Pseudobdellovibrionaceae bacterium]
SKLAIAASALLLAASAGAIVGGLNLLLGQVYEASDFYGNGATNVVINSDSVSTNCPSGVGPHGPSTPCIINQNRARATLVTATSINYDSLSGSFMAGDTVLVIQMTGSGAGSWEFSEVATDSGTSMTLVASKALRKTYLANATQVIKVDEFNNVTINSGGFLTSPAWNGTTGGVFAMQVAGTLTMDDGSSNPTTWPTQKVPSHISMGYVNVAGFMGGVGTFAARGFRGNNVVAGGEAAYAGASGQSISPGSHEYLIMGGGSINHSSASAGGGVVIVKARATAFSGRISVAGAAAPGNTGAVSGVAYLSSANIDLSDATCGAFNLSGGTGATSGPMGRGFVNYGRDPAAGDGSISAACSNVATLFGGASGTIRRYHLK